ncbi:hypothetical protein Dip510_000122 [Elusimicrobium posterum]|uniref:hypothetical protein n=1 Tax=Elusimicrobium posterum TaxID=3116653 RepID=UPI003C76A77C
MARQDVLDDQQKFNAAITYTAFIQDVKNNPAEWRAILDSMKADDMARAQQEQAQQKATVKYDAEYFKKAEYSLDQYKMEVPDYLDFNKKTRTPRITDKN